MPRTSPLTLLRFATVAVNKGHVFPGVKGYEPYESTHLVWAHAWDYAVTTGLGYAEGVVYREGRWQAHAWCVTEDGAVIETRDGFGDATEYRGWQIDTNAVAAVLLSTGEGLSGPFLAAATNVEDVNWSQVIDRFAFIPGTAF